MPKVLYIINEAHGLFNRTGTVLSFTYRNADHLAHLGVEQNEELVIVVAGHPYLLKGVRN